MGRSRVVGAFVAGVVVATALVGGGAWAASSFPDVPPTSPFHDDVGRIADAGITTGYPDGTYRPGAPVTRGAMASFMSRGFSGISDEVSSALLVDDTSVDVVATAVQSPSPDPASQGYVVIQASGTFSAAGGCPCAVRYGLSLNSATLPGTFNTTTIPASSGELTTESIGFSVSRAVPLAGTQTGTYHLVAQLVDEDATGAEASAWIGGTYVPFDAAPAL